ncbi:response regulator [Alsobacter sp. SYSU M60028]|uniref:Response regulator n=1 Tax=Alsobacter ponti TaxID=2962936 RepID=A0ABT1L8J9_9HYPH|nr:response regulator [Alsobacter ponti]MCP8937253.1 response regulator [Alsobacter ponti]
MSIAQAIAPHLPYLRRFARALSGTQQGGDAYALATLEALVADPDSFDETLEPRVALYQAFLKVWNSIAVNRIPDAPPTPGAMQAGVGRSLAALTPPARVAFLLNCVEGFTPQQIGQAMEKTDEEIDELISAAGREIAQQMATAVLIIEDEPIIAMDLEALVEGLGHRVIDIARTRSEAVDAVQRQQPGLVLADIQLADGSSGVDAVNDILGDFEVPVIFITAYPERFLTGQRPEPAFLITKPFRTETVKAVISQALFFDQKSHRTEKAAAG